MTAAESRLHPSISMRLGAEALGTFPLVLGVIGAATFSASFHDGTDGLNVGFLGVALALGLTVVGGAYAWRPVAGGHFNPAVTVGLATAGRFPWASVGGYVAAQVLGGVAASSVLVAVASGGPDGFLIGSVTTALFIAALFQRRSGKQAADSTMSVPTELRPR